MRNFEIVWGDTVIGHTFYPLTGAFAQFLLSITPAIRKHVASDKAATELTFFKLLRPALHESFACTFFKNAIVVTDDFSLCLKFIPKHLANTFAPLVKLYTGCGVRHTVAGEDLFDQAQFILQAF